MMIDEIANTTNRRILPQFVSFCGLMLLFTGCASELAADGTEAVPRGLVKQTSIKVVEIAPGKWMTISQTNYSYDEAVSLTIAPDQLPKEYTRLRIRKGEKTLEWSGVAIPISLREQDGSLFLIGFDRDTNREHPTFRYFREQDQSMIEIRLSQYPKQIATQNMWFGSSDQETMKLDLTRKLDVDNVRFQFTLTALVWDHLLTGKDFHEHVGEQADAEVIKRYRAEFSPVPLPTIVRQSDAASVVPNK